MRALKAMRVAVHTRRVVRYWLKERTFQVKMRMGDTVYVSAIHGISRGLPQGGVLSPPLWLIYFDQILPRLKAKREE